MAFGTVKADALQTDSRIIGVDEIVGLEPNVVPALGDSVFWNGIQWVAASGGTITSAALQVPSGLAVAGSPIVSSGTFVVTYASGHQGYTTAEADKLATVASGAEVNVNADWTAASGDAFILNKPILGTAAALNVGTSSGNVVQLDGLAKLPAVDGSQLTGINSTTDLSYDTSTRFLDSSTGSGVTLPIFASGIDGFVPAASGGTTSFLREDGTWQPVVGSTNLSYDDSTRVLSSSTGSGVTLPVFASGVAGLVPATSNGGTTTFLRADGTFAAPPGAGGISDGDKGDITVSASGATWTIDDGAVTLAKQADVATDSVFYRKTAGTGPPEVQTLATLKTDLGLSGTNSGDQDLSGKANTGAVGSTGITMSTDRLLGRSTASTGAIEEITLGTNLSFTGTTLNATGGGTPGGSDTQIQFNDGGAFGGDVDLTYDKTTNKLTTKGDVELNDGGTFTTTVQVVTPTANRTISYPDATGTIGLVAGSSGQLIYNNAGAQAGVGSDTVIASGPRFSQSFGYGTGAGGTVTQATNKATGVTLSTSCGIITLNGAALAADTTVSFVLTNTLIGANDVLVLNHASAGTAGAYTLNAQAAAGSASINVRNVTAGSLSEAIVIRFAVIKATTT